MKKKFWKVVYVFSYMLMIFSVALGSVAFLGLICECEQRYIVEEKAISIFSFMISVVLGYFATILHEKSTSRTAIR